MAKYDEDIHENLFFCTFRDKFPSLFDLVAENCWMTCVPRADVAARMKISKTDIENHILIKDQDSDAECSEKGTLFTSLNGSYVLIKKDIIATKSGFKEAKEVRILFSEDFYNASDQSYQILCIDQPFEGGVDDSNFSLVASMETVQDCSAFLWNDSAGEKVKKTIDGLCSDVCIANNQVHLTGIKEVALRVYESAYHEAKSKLHQWKKSSSLSASSFFHLAIESYVLDKLHPQVFKSLCRLQLGDKEMNKITRMFDNVSHGELGIADEFKENLLIAGKFLDLLNMARCPLEKLNCFKKTMTALIKSTNSSRQKSAVSADEFLPMLVYLVLKAEIPNWRCNIHYIKEFHFSQVSNEELMYYLTSFEAAVEYITSGDLQKNLEKDFCAPKLPDTSEVEGIEKTSALILRNLLKTVCNGDLASVQTLVSKMKKLPDEICQQLCHPLCDCEKCAPIVKEYNNHPSRVSLLSKDMYLRGSLHYAVTKGHQDVLEWLLENTDLRDDVDEQDINKQTVLHLAALTGSKQILLYLLYKKPNVNKVDRQGNTALHLACSHGHEECVKVLLFHTEKCNPSAKNNHGDTPLHLAARWGYASIVAILLEHGADPKVKNSFEVTPINTTYDFMVYQCIRSTLEVKDSIRLPPDASVSSTSPGSSVKFRHHSVPSEQNDEGVGGTGRPGTGGGSRVTQWQKRRSSGFTNSKAETEKQIKKLFRAIADNDFAMVKYLLGWKNSSQNAIEQTDGGAEPTTSDPKQSLLPDSSDFCHPLCQCEKCLHLRKSTRLYPLVTINSCDLKGNTPLHKASLHGHRQIVEALLKQGAAKNAISRDEKLTPLHLACQYNHRDIVMILLEHGVQVNPCDSQGNTPLHFCCNNGHMDSAKLLMIHGADLTISNDRGDTPLHRAARWNHATLVRELLLYGAMYSSSNRNGKTPLQLTTDEEVYDIIQQAMKGEIPTGQYADHKYADDPGYDDPDEEFEHIG